MDFRFHFLLYGTSRKSFQIFSNFFHLTLYSPANPLSNRIVVCPSISSSTTRWTCSYCIYPGEEAFAIVAFFAWDLEKKTSCAKISSPATPQTRCVQERNFDWLWVVRRCRAPPNFAILPVHVSARLSLLPHALQSLPLVNCENSGRTNNLVWLSHCMCACVINRETKNGIF